MSNTILEIIEERCSIRSYTDEVVSSSLINEILDAARKAPSAGNIQPWKFIVVYNTQVKDELAAASGQDFVAQAPVNVVVCAEPGRSEEIYGERGRELYCIQDTAAAVENILLTATAFGLGTCWVGAFDEERVGKSLGLSGDFRPVTIIPIGYTDSGKKKKNRRSLEDIVEIIK